MGPGTIALGPISFPAFAPQTTAPLRLRPEHLSQANSKRSAERQPRVRVHTDSTVPAGVATMSLQAGDIDRDGQVDLVAVSNGCIGVSRYNDTSRVDGSLVVTRRSGATWTPTVESPFIVLVQVSAQA